MYYVLTGPCSGAVVIDDSCVTQLIKVDLVNRDTDGSFTNMDMSGSIEPYSSAVCMDNSCVTQFTVSATTTDDGSIKTEHDSRDLFAEVKLDSLPDIKDEPEDVCYHIYIFWNVGSFSGKNSKMASRPAMSVGVYIA